MTWSLPFHPTPSRQSPFAQGRCTGRFIVILLLTLVLFPSCKPQESPSQSPATQTEPQLKKTSPPATKTHLKQDEGLIVAMGDSLTAGLGVPEDEAYPALLEAKLRSNGYPFRVINAGISGETSSGALSRTAWTLTLKPDIVILETGANDGLRGISPDLTQKNIRSIVQQFQDQGVVVVLAGMRMVENLGDTYTTAFAAIYQNIAQEAAQDTTNAPGLVFMPFFLDGVAANPGLNQADGIHPTADGYRHIVSALYPYVTTAITQSRQNKRQ